METLLKIRKLIYLALLFIKEIIKHAKYIFKFKSDGTQFEFITWKPKFHNLKNILIIDYSTPTFDNDSGSNRSYQLLNIYRELGNHVTYIGTPLIFIPNPVRLKELKEINIEAIYMPMIFSIRRFLKYYGLYFDVIILCRESIAKKYFSYVKKFCPKAKIIFDTVDLHYVRELRKAKINNDPIILAQAENIKKNELYFSENSDATLVVSEIERKTLLNESTRLNNIFVVSNIHYVRPPVVPYKDRSGIMFLGYFGHEPNVDAVHFFVKDIFPKVLYNYPDMILYIVGGSVPNPLLKYQSMNVILTDYAPALTKYFDTCKFLVAPLRYGAGVKGKIGNAMANGLPVITTSIGAEGMHLTDGINAIIIDGADHIANRICDIYNNEQLWNLLSANSMEHINRNFSYSIAKTHVRELFKIL